MTPTPRLAFITIVATLAYLGLAILGWGGFAAFFSHPALIALAIALFVLSGVALFSGGNLSPGEREDRANRWVFVPFALIGLLNAYLPAYTDRIWVLDPRRRCHSLAWRRSLRRWWCVADLAGLCARPSVQRVSSHPARAHAGHERCLWSHPPPQLSGVARQLAGVGPRLSFGGRRAAHGAHYPATPRAHPRGREAAAYAVRRRVRCLLRPDVTADPQALLMRAAAEGPVWVERCRRLLCSTD